MILPVYAFGNSVLTRPALPLDRVDETLRETLVSMWETMYEAGGVGLAAPQVGLGLRVFIVDTLQMKNSEKSLPVEGIREVFINPTILEESGAPCTYEEGCLSIPDIRGEVERLPELRLVWRDEGFQLQERMFRGMEARVIQHEYDHLEGKLFIDYLSPARKVIIRGKLENIRRGKVSCDYYMHFAPR